MSFLRRKRRGKPSAAPAAEAAPPSPPPASPTRDGYGFVVKPAFADAYRAHVPMFVREEEERRERWMAFLERASHPTSPVAAGHASASGDGRDPRRHGAPAVLSSSGSGLDAVEEILRNRDRGACSADAPRRERELESLVRGGVPMAIRGELWQLCLRVDEVRVPGAYQTLAALVDDDVNDHLYCEDAKDAKDGASLDVPGVASSEEKEEARRSFVWSAQKTWGPLTKHTREQIAKDVPRTFPGHAQLDSLPMRRALERVLRAFAVASPSVGYCQGMNFIAGVFLLLMEEEAAFWSLSQVLKLILPEYFSIKGAMKAHLVDQEVLRELAELNTLALVKALDENGCPLHAVASSWFMALFANALPWETCLRVWDVTLFERTRTPLFQTALAVMELDQMTTRKGDKSRVFETATTMASRAFDASALVMHATCGHADVTWRLLEALCAKHAARMEREGRFDDDTKETPSAHDDACTEDDARGPPSPARVSSVQKDFQEATFLTDRDPTRRPDVDASDADSRGWRTPGVPAPATRAKVVASPASRRNVGSGGSRGSRSSERRWRDVLAKGAGVSRLRADAERENKSSAERERAERERAERGDDFEDVETRFLPDDELFNSRRPEENASRVSAAADLSPSSARVRATESSSSERSEVARLKKELRVALRRADDAEKASSSTSATLKTTLEALADRDRAVARLSAQTKELLAMLHERDAETIERHRAAASGRKTRTEGARTSSAPSAS